ncbi:MAG: outer membrane lipoprotein carrier protein LolA, partial [Deltaproteobacteria bacterium]|nr:outer membrane lipoprotein carrier protein LolA [Deltaproteobacteria bacterium]
IKIVCMRILFAYLFFKMLFYAAPATAERRLSDILDSILNRYGNLPGIEVSYERQIITGSMALLGDQITADKASGRIYFKPKDFLKVLQEKPDTEIVTTDGNNLWWVIPKKNIVYKYPSDRLGKELKLLSGIFYGLKEVGDNFDVVQSELGDEQNYQLQLFPNPQWQEIEHINLTVSTVTFNILVVEIYNYLGGITRFVLGEPVVNGKLSKSFFKFVPPEGIEVIEE